METNPSSFEPCEHCGGRGFLRAGDFADRTFPRCAYCKGLGQKYLNPVPEPRGMDGKVLAVRGIALVA